MQILVRKSFVILSIVVAIFVFVGFVAPQAVEAQGAKEAVCDSLLGNENCVEDDDSATVDGMLQTALNILSFVAGVIAVIMIIIAGLKFMTSQGDASKAASARNTVIYAIIGIVIVVLSQVIVQFVLSESQPTPDDEEDGDDSSMVLPRELAYDINVSELIEK